MKIARTIAFSLAVIGLSSVAIAGCTNNSNATRTNDTTSTASVQSSIPPAVIQTPETQKSTTEQPVVPEKNPPGDIPDNQAFVAYSSASGGYKLEVPEGWARRTDGKNVSFTDKFDGVKVAVTNEANPITAATVQTQQVAKLKASGRAVQVVNVKDIQLPGGKAVLIEYTSNSEPDGVTGKQIRLENNSYLFFKNGKVATLTVFAPQGADNVDQWQRISRSFRWF